MKHFILTIFSFAMLSSFAYAQECDMPEITATSGSYCPGDTEVTLKITGDLGSATKWEWYTGSCGVGVIEDKNDTSITVNISDASSYFVRGVGEGEDNCVGTTAQCTEIKVVLDNEPPVADCPDNIVMDAEPGMCTATVDYTEPIPTDNCEGEITVDATKALGSGATFPVGITTETYIFTDANGNESTCSFTITVEDKEPPVILCQPDFEVDNDVGECGAVVTYELPTAVDICDGDIEVDDSGAIGSGSFFPVGTTIETYTATDDAGNMSSCSIEVTVIDVELPVITLKKNKTSKWPPNHKHFEIKIADYIESATDNCPGVTKDDIIIAGASSDEAQNDKGDGNTDDDIMISDDCKTIKLLAERAGGGNGRVYTVNLAVMDAHGNIGVAEIKAEISHDQSKKKSVIDDGPAYEVEGCELIYEEDDAEIQPVEETQNIAVNESEENQMETYPNPVNNSLKIDYVPDFDDHISIDLYNLSGSRMRHLFDGHIKKQRQYSWTFDLGELNDKIFLLVLQGNKTKNIRKVVRQ